jgi:hypothetical protein
MHTALKFISVLLEIISPMLFVRQHQKLILTDLNSTGANTVNMSRKVSICINFPPLTCFKSHRFQKACFLWSFISMSLVCLFDLNHWHIISSLFIALKIILAFTCSLMFKTPYILQQGLYNVVARWLLVTKNRCRHWWSFWLRAIIPPTYKYIWLVRVHVGSGDSWH